VRGRKFPGLLPGRYLKTVQEVLWGNNSILLFDTTRTAYKTTPPAIPHCRWNIFIELLSSYYRRRLQTLLWYYTDRTENDSSNNYLIVCNNHILFAIYTSTFTNIVKRYTMAYRKALSSAPL
jgi:hypothetical protein